jgi:IPTL-CTERM motif
MNEANWRRRAAAWWPLRATQPARKRRLRTNMWGLALLASVLSTAATADLVVPVNSGYTLNGGSADLGCTDLIVNGALVVDGGSITGIRNVTINAGGSITASSGALALSGNWSNFGVFNAGTGSVSFVDLAGCAAAGGTISGNTTFARLVFTTSVGKTFLFAAGATQSINQNLTVQGAPGAPIIWRSTNAGQLSNIALVGTQNTANFGASDIAATSAKIATGLGNALAGGGNTPGMFGDASLSVPTLSSLALSLLSLLLAGCAFVGRRHTQHHSTFFRRTGL